jgi:pyruvate ferredoxin oxidoreductase delta subunit
MKKKDGDKFPQVYVTDIVGTFPKEHWRVFRPEVDKKLCKLCWLCVDFCPEGCLTRKDEGIEVDLRFCKGCGICSNECRFSAIRMIRE